MRHLVPYCDCITHTIFICFVLESLLLKKSQNDDSFLFTSSDCAYAGQNCSFLEVNR